MRQIKFRAWDKINNDVKEVALLSFVDRGVLLWTNGKQVRATVERDMSDVELLQNTNFRDLNGKEIYEGDILEDVDGARVIVAMREGKWVVLTPKNEDRAVWGTTLWLAIGDEDDGGWLRVVGNIFENKELLEAIDGNISD